MAADQTITVRGEQELTGRAGHLFASSRSEFICAAMDMNTWSRPKARPAVASKVFPGLDRGNLVVRKLYSSAAVVDEEQRLHLLDLVAAGALVRICASPLPHETIIIDRRAMILAGERTQGDRDFTITTEPALIAAVHTMFRAVWDAAPDLGTLLNRELPQLDSDGREILRMLGSGRTDASAARRMGLSLRTYRRRVADLMQLLDAESRFQAGMRAGELGLMP